MLSGLADKVLKALGLLSFFAASCSVGRSPTLDRNEVVRFALSGVAEASRLKGVRPSG